MRACLYVSKNLDASISISAPYWIPTSCTADEALMRPVPLIVPCTALYCRTQKTAARGGCHLWCTASLSWACDGVMSHNCTASGPCNLVRALCHRLAVHFCTSVPHLLCGSQKCDAEQHQHHSATSRNSGSSCVCHVSHKTDSRRHPVCCLLPLPTAMLDIDLIKQKLPGNGKWCT